MRQAIGCNCRVSPRGIRLAFASEQDSSRICGKIHDCDRDSSPIENGVGRGSYRLPMLMSILEQVFRYFNSSTLRNSAA